MSVVSDSATVTEIPRSGVAPKWVDLLFAATAFLGSSLLFVVQPIVAKQLLPTLGGSPGVWATCVVFFQAVLALAYAWAHYGPRFMGDRAHLIAHILLLAIACAQVPLVISTDRAADTTGNPAIAVLTLLSIQIAIPMLAVCATSPLIQRWHARVNPSRGDGVYRLYSVGNVASLLILLAYPTLFEPFTRLATQHRMWGIAFVVLAGMIGLCGVLAWKSRDGVKQEAKSAGTVATSDRIWWLILSALPSSLLVGVTTFLTTDIAAVPFLWVVPLAVYLGAFSLAFAGIGMPEVVRFALMPAMALLTLVVIGTEMTLPVTLALLLHVGMFAVVTMGCLNRLWLRKPDPSHLTDFYLWIAIGGVLGGAFNTLAAPFIFKTAMEYPLALILAIALAIFERREKVTGRDIYITGGLALAVALLMTAVIVAQATFSVPIVYAFLATAIPMFFAFTARREAIRFGILLAIIYLAPVMLSGRSLNVLQIERGFFGVHRVILSPDRRFIELSHGTTLHGRQYYDVLNHKPERPTDALSYFHRQGPLGAVMDALPADRDTRVAVVGLGAGSIASYATPKRRFTFFEIDPLVIYLARDSGRFTFLSAASERGAPIELIEGDARLTLAKYQGEQFDLLIMDAFSGDSVPTHLISREAFETYRKRVKPDGMILVHVSNRYLTLAPVVGRNAKELGLAALVGADEKPPTDETSGRAGSQWVIMASDEARLTALRDHNWTPCPTDAAVWSDDYSNLFGAIRWR